LPTSTLARGGQVMSKALRDSPIRDAYEACAPSSFRRARELLGNEADAWDVVHKVFCRLAESDLLARAQPRPMAYVYRATTNACLNELEARRVRGRSVPGQSDTTRAHGEAIHARDQCAPLPRAGRGRLC
jgi:DNA-directed RNA polymerase specialized sigma24 family protein